MTQGNLKGLEGTRPCPSLKIAYADKPRALAALRDLNGRKQARMAKTGVDALESQRAYLCDECTQWHTTSKPLKHLMPPEVPAGSSLALVVEALVSAMRNYHSGLVFPTGDELTEAYPPYDGYGIRSLLLQKGWLDLGDDGAFLTRRVQREI